MQKDSFLSKLDTNANITLIGMPGVGKSTIGNALAKLIAFAPLDSDYLIEALYGVNLQEVADRLTKEQFLDLEAEVVSKIRVNRTVIATGGSVVYRDNAMQHLKSMGPCVFLSAPLDLILERIALNPDRGLAIGPNQTIEDLYEERKALYTKYADFIVEVDRNSTPSSVATSIADFYR